MQWVTIFTSEEIAMIQEVVFFFLWSRLLSAGRIVGDPIGIDAHEIFIVISPGHLPHEMG